ncbi:uncharacterized protein LOC134208986 [Armigeres subalbatus]|uniref:uncharacterized protein LOC134208986 n=1 Tax=Armigeres subalbatus TaxID=124917 RepID=UPI002ED67B90
MDKRALESDRRPRETPSKSPHTVVPLPSCKPPRITAKQSFASASPPVASCHRITAKASFASASPPSYVPLPHPASSRLPLSPHRQVASRNRITTKHLNVKTNSKLLTFGRSTALLQGPPRPQKKTSMNDEQRYRARAAARATIIPTRISQTSVRIAPRITRPRSVCAPHPRPTPHHRHPRHHLPPL